MWKGERETDFSRFMKWCRDHNIQCDKVEVSTYDGLGAGLKALEPIQVGVVLSTIVSSGLRVTSTSLLRIQAPDMWLIVNTKYKKVFYIVLLVSGSTLLFWMEQFAEVLKHSARYR